MEDEGLEDAPEGAHNGLLLFAIAAVLMEVFFVLLLIDRHVLHQIGLNTIGPLRSMSAQSATIVSAGVLGAGFVAGFFLYSQMGSRVGGVIAIPLAAVETLSSPAVVPYLLLGVGVSYAVGEIFFRRLLIYGRRLFYVYLTVSVLVMVQILAGYSLDPMSFSFIIPGIIAYNLHVDRDKRRSAVIAILYFAGLAILGAALIIGGL